MLVFVGLQGVDVFLELGDLGLEFLDQVLVLGPLLVGDLGFLGPLAGFFGDGGDPLITLGRTFTEIGPLLADFLLG